MSKLALKLIAENKAKHARGEDASYLSHYESLGDLKHHFGEQLKKLGIG